MEKQKNKRREHIKIDKVGAGCIALGRTCTTVTKCAVVAIGIATLVGYSAYKVADYRFKNRK